MSGNEQHLVRTEPKSLYIANSDEADVDGLAILSHALASYAPPVTFTYEPMLDEHHGTIYPRAALRGLRTVFARLR